MATGLSLFAWRSAAATEATSVPIDAAGNPRRMHGKWTRFGERLEPSPDAVSGRRMFTLFVVSSSRDLVDRALLQMKHERAA
jgi:hypothetical protein